MSISVKSSARYALSGAVLACFVSACVTVHGPVKLKAPLQKPVKALLVTNPVVKGKQKSIRNLTERISVKSIEDEIQIAYNPVKAGFLRRLSETGTKTSSTKTRYSYADLFDANGQPRKDKIKALLYDPDKLLVVPVVTISEKKSDVPVDSRNMCPGQYHSTMKLSLVYLDSRGKLLLDSSEIPRDKASIEQGLHGLLVIKKKCGMVYNKSRAKNKFRTQFEQIRTDYLKEVLPTKKS